ncbi:16S rRNA (cytosine(1402)-N(4))-methyltransferase RsmH [Pseudoteredinibacter isoporae]|uniref:Ribosomal RNA small subunit methyltransferase H n=1 Tax=Pseudoteredinibacter isoporae TaxID=570281 RepID=A0A7X0MZ38_9GAMM|nr:16S rRNA (cytosine(1402)-N(4))-methyltransferase RsmH [Pseudoteredinibacter isoporae]MBB6522737.1 16S rRNA (cytosine1402-N4)-methyltransferase [Pseudoteredinibacter isoporae]NHO88266.1 16S rRNA (cytosine(1402)-N(4))-methyltransferase RsmH [Pseudoteredinibacter isoporae]NIB23403.1 16S rRNA (cytosine(1402)-N(4))-methyltransferase RsmH [Pseudoteredinibacter isoporae]
MSDSPHYSVLLDEAVTGLLGDEQGFYIDGTFGRGGHSARILDALGSKARLLAIDKDPEAIAVANERFGEEKRFEIAHGSFAQVEEFVAERGMEGLVDGILLDLGVSSPQLDEAERGFSFMQDGPLDMRMNSDAGMTAADWVNSAEETEIARVLKEYGEERFAKRIARAIVESRQAKTITRTLQLARIVAEANPAWEKGKNPATRAFQGIRIHINNELGDLESVLEQSLRILKPGGRLVVISFHSLEDRLVKRFIRRQEKGQELPPGLPVTEDQLDKTMRSIGKAVKADADELAENIRSRSAVMRVAQKL